MLDKKELNWQDKQKLENVMQRQQDLQNKIERPVRSCVRVSNNSRSSPNDERLLENSTSTGAVRECMSEEMKELYRQVQE